MTGSRLQLLVLAFCACGAGPALAGSGDITKRDQNSGSVELSNLGDEDAPVVVSAPARQVIQAAVKPAPSAVSAPPARETVATERPTDAQQARKRQRDKDEEEAVSSEGGERGDYAGGVGSYNRDAYAATGGSSGVYGYGGGGIGAGSGSIGYDTGSSGSTTGNASGNSTSGSGSYGGTSAGGSTSASTGGSGSSATYVDATAGAGSAPTAGLSPDLLALRIAQYRDMMLNEQRGANGLVSNPAVQRRYLMMNRAGFMGRGF